MSTQDRKQEARTETFTTSEEWKQWLLHGGTKTKAGYKNNLKISSFCY